MSPKHKAMLLQARIPHITVVISVSNMGNVSSGIAAHLHHMGLVCQRDPASCLFQLKSNFRLNKSADEAVETLLKLSPLGLALNKL